MKRCFSLLLCFFASFVIYLFPPPHAHADEKIGLSDGQTIYVPAYSHIYSGDREKPFLLTVTLSIRNIDPRHQINITQVNYYDTKGKVIKTYLNQSVLLSPLESRRYVIPEKDNAGGSGANFIVEWKSGKFVNPPIVESIMIGTQSQQGISFTSRGRVIIPSTD
jgi:hypothetical protein